MRVFRGSAYIVLAKSLGCHSPWSISVEDPTSTQRTATAKISASHGLLMSLVVSHGFFGRVFPLKERLACSMAVCPMDSKSFSWQNIT